MVRHWITRRWRWVGTVTATILIVMGVVMALVPSRHSTASAVASTSVAGVPGSLAQLMHLGALPGASAPDFTLSDQNGLAMSLSGLSGKVVVLTFMDPHCTDICPIVSAEFTRAYQELGVDKSRVVFMAVNVNPYHGKTADMLAWSQHQGLAAIPSWHFVTGSLAALKNVWAAYTVSVDATSPNADVHHTSVIYFIDPMGLMRYVAAPVSDKNARGLSYLPLRQQLQWAHGIAQVARDLLQPAA